MAATVPIASLQPFEDFPFQNSIRAEISLLWPYSSSHDSCALLLVDPDYRQRHAKGQVRVRFRGAAAQALVKAHVGIGDHVRLELTGARWQEKDVQALSHTPGRALEAELVFERTLHLTVLQDGSEDLDGRVIQLDGVGRHTSPEQQLQDIPATPLPNSSTVASLGLGTSVVGGYSSPAFMKRLRLSQGHFLDSPGLAEAEDDLDGEGARKRRRVSYKNVTEWKFAKESPVQAPQSSEDDDEAVPDLNLPSSIDNVGGPLEEPKRLEPAKSRDVEGTASQPMHISSSPEPESDDVEEEFDEEVENGPLASPRKYRLFKDSGRNEATPPAKAVHPFQNESTSATMPPPRLPPLQIPSATANKSLETTPIRPRTPELIAVSAATLPLPSPFPQTPLARTPLEQPRHPLLDNGLPVINEDIGYFNSKASPDFLQIDSPTRKGANLPLEVVLRQPETALPSDDHVLSPNSGSQADVSSEEDEAVHQKETVPLHQEAEYASPRNHVVAPIAQPNEGIQMSAPAEKSPSPSTAEPMTSPKSASISRFPTPSDDEDDIDTRLNTTFMEDTAIMDSQSQFGSALPTPLEGSSQPSPIVLPSKLPHFNEHHPYGMDGASLSKGSKLAHDVDGENGESENDEQPSQDEDAAWAAMDEAMQTVSKNSHEVLQAPAIPLTSTIDPTHVKEPSEHHPRRSLDGLQSWAKGMADLKQEETEIRRQARKDHGLLADSLDQYILDGRRTVVPDSQKSQATLLPVPKTDQLGDEVDKLRHPRLNEEEMISKQYTEGFKPDVAEVDTKAPSSDETPKAMEKQTSLPAPTTATKLKARPPSRLSLAPDSLETWFTSRKPAIDLDQDRRNTISILPQEPPTPVSEPAPDKRAISPPPLKRYTHSQGTITNLTYLTPLTNLELHLNNPSGKIDVLAVATRSSSEPTRAKSGARDWFTVIYVTDPKSFEQEVQLLDSQSQAISSDHVHDPKSSQASQVSQQVPKQRHDIRIEVYRPWKASLPSVSGGDVILLRNFVVRSRNHRLYLLSEAESAWCSFRNEGTEMREDIPGPPVEIGDEERDEAERLRGWWARDVSEMVQKERGSARRKGKARATL